MQSLLNSYGLTSTTVCWEDTARAKNSCWGPNISDMTLRSKGKDCQVIRRPNFADITVDHSIDNFKVTVGNEDNSTLRQIPLTEYLENLKIYVDDDEKILCSTQACILEGDSGDIPFNVRLYNYQTTTENPAVLVIIASNQGTSAQVLDAKTTDILFNKNGRAHDYIAERLKEERLRLGKSIEGELTQDEKERNVIFIYQVPLVIPKIYRNYKCAQVQCLGGYGILTFGGGSSDYLIEKSEFLSVSNSRNVRGFDHAMLRVSDTDKGVFLGTRGKKLVRDTDFPIRCTLQYYYITDTKEMTEPLVKSISEQLEKFYTHSENKSSLVMGQTNRPTEPKVNKPVEMPQFTTGMNTYAY
jgi:hypothetical protein